MSEEQDKEQQTEEATPKRKAKLREDGKVAQSADIPGAAVLAGVGLTLTFTSEGIGRSLAEFSERMFRLQDATEPTQAIGAFMSVLTSAGLPVVAVATVAATAAGVAQTGGMFNITLAAPKPERLNPIPNMGKLLPTKETFIEIGKQLLKMVAIGYVIYGIVADATPHFAVLPASEPIAAASTVISWVKRVALHGVIALTLVAALDYWLARRKFNEESKMTKKDVRDEAKESEGNPQIKRRMRQQMRELTRRRAVADVSKATVLVTNPTHFAVALRYVPGKDPAPLLIAKGTGDLALKMRTEARKHRVPIVENRPLARALHRDGKVGKVIPFELYRAAAEVIAHVMRLRGAMAS